MVEYCIVKCNVVLCFLLISATGWLVNRRSTFVLWRKSLRQQAADRPYYWLQQSSRILNKPKTREVQLRKYNRYSFLSMNAQDEQSGDDTMRFFKEFNLKIDPEEALVEFPVHYLKDRVDAHNLNLSSLSNEMDSSHVEEGNKNRSKLKVPWKNLVPSVDIEQRDSWMEYDDSVNNDRMSWYDPADIGCLELRPEGFSQSFVLVGVFSGNYFRLREMLWDYHLQWIRRTQLMRYLPLSASNITESGLCSVDKAMTILSYDRLMPLAQVLFVSANSTADFLRYLEREPFFKEGLLEWKICKLDRYGVDIDEFHEIPRAPYVFLHLNTNASEESHQLYDSVSRESRKFYQDAATSNDKSLRYDIFSRVSYLGDVNHMDSDNRVGQVLMFNAKSHADALQFICRSPYGKLSGVDEELLYKSITEDPYNVTILGAINMLDCDGRARVSCFSPLPYQKSVNIGDESPEELLYQFTFKFDDDNAKEHYEENKRVLKALRQYNITIDVPNSFYEQPVHLKADLEEFEESLTFIDDRSANIYAFHALAEADGTEDSDEDTDLNESTVSTNDGEDAD